MSRALHRRLLPILAFMLLMNAVTSPLMAHNGGDGMATTSLGHSPPPCHEHETGNPAPSSHHSGGLPCCGGGMHCGCMSVPAGLTLLIGLLASVATHDSTNGPVEASAPQAQPDSLLRPPIS